MKRLRLIKEQRGNVLALVSISIAVLLGLSGLVIDGGTMYVTRAQLQKTANAAALSGAQELLNSETAVKEVVHNILMSHDENESMDILDIHMRDRVTVGLTREIRLGFGGLFGLPSTPVSVKATAELGVMGEAVGVAPVGIDERMLPLAFDQEYTLKVGPGDSDTGYFGILALDDQKAQTYGYNLMYGFQKPISIGDEINVRDGNVAGETREGVNYRIQNCPDPSARDCKRILLIPVYKPLTYSGSKHIDTVEVLDFAFFYISKPMAHNDDSVKGRFIEYAGTGIIKPGPSGGTGAFAIRLTE
ncbi:Tad domain-containing protein [Paenibacillus alkalitolerans]|uniref:Tad domain-containing protein n=1 Tax=Paenibacillus alkalitolerans TaxID=2799335 RepID=UPI0018F5E199|nr:Tad domain-containing protein [Paenibacillus alkalitolerans]